VLLHGVGAEIPSDAEVKVALQSILVAGIASYAAQSLPQSFPESIFTTDSAFTNMDLIMDQADVGHLRSVVLESPLPPVKQMGFFEALLTSVLPIMPDYPQLVSYLKPQALYEEEVILSGTVDAVRLAAPYPFRYEGSASLVVEGSRFRFPFSLYVEYIIPLEGPYSSSIIPLVITANDQDFLHVGQALFPRIRN